MGISLFDYILFNFFVFDYYMRHTLTHKLSRGTDTIYIRNGLVSSDQDSKRNN